MLGCAVAPPNLLMVFFILAKVLLEKPGFSIYIFWFSQLGRSFGVSDKFAKHPIAKGHLLGIEARGNLCYYGKVTSLLETAMTTEEITIRVDRAAALAFKSASAEERRKLEVILSIRLQEAFYPDTSLQEVMDDMSREAQARGLTPEILQSLLNNE